MPEAVLDDLRDRLARTRWPDQIPGSGWGYGTDLAYLQDLYRRVNAEGHTRAAATCPSCGHEFGVDIAGGRVGES